MIYLPLYNAGLPKGVRISELLHATQHRTYCTQLLLSRWTQGGVFFLTSSFWQRSEYSSYIQCNSLIQDVVVETGLCKGVVTAISDFPLSGRSQSHFSVSFSCKHTLAKSSLSRISTTPIPTLSLSSPGLSGWSGWMVEKMLRAAIVSQLFSFQNLRFLLQCRVYTSAIGNMWFTKEPGNR